MANPNLSYAAALARVLNHGCAPAEGLEFSSVDELEAAMTAAADADNARVPDGGPAWATPWTREGDSLIHVTGSGRMRVSVSERELRVELFSPTWVKGEKPFFRLVTNEMGEIVEAAIEHIARWVVEQKLGRIEAVGRFIAPALGEERVLAALVRKDRLLVLLEMEERESANLQLPERRERAEQELARVRELLAKTRKWKS